MTHNLHNNKIIRILININFLTNFKLILRKFFKLSNKLYQCIPFSKPCVMNTEQSQINDTNLLPIMYVYCQKVQLFKCKKLHAYMALQSSTLFSTVISVFFFKILPMFTQSLHALLLTSHLHNFSFLSIMEYLFKK